MSKARVGLRLKEVVKSSSSTNRNIDLDAAAARFRVLQKQLKALICTLRQQHASMVALQKNRCETVKIVTTIASNSPLIPITGRLSDGAALITAMCAESARAASPSENENNAENRNPQQFSGSRKDTAFGAISVPEKLPLSTALTKMEHNYASVHLALFKRSVMYSDKFNQFVIQYVVQWENTISKRIGSGLKAADKLRIDLDHYSKKVESMRVCTTKAMQSGKIVDPKQTEKLKRNEAKLMKSREVFSTFSHKLYLLIDEVVSRAWKDLYPVLVKLVQFDANYSADEAKILSELNETSGILKLVANEHKLDAKGRLKDLQDFSAEDLYTGEKETYSLPRIEGPKASDAGFGGDGMSWGGGPGLGSGGGLSGDSNDPFSPAQSFSSASNDDGMFGMGAFSHSQNNYNSQSSAYAPTSTLDMMNAAASSAPAPTMDMVNELTGSTGNMSYGVHSGLNGTRHLSMTSPPGNPSFGNGGFSGNLSSSSHDFDSMNGMGGYGSGGGLFGSPPPNERPPPPASAPPPPPPSQTLTMYSGNSASSSQFSMNNSYGDLPMGSNMPQQNHFGCSMSSYGEEPRKSQFQSHHSQSMPVSSNPFDNF